MENENLHKKKWERPELKIFNISQTSGGGENTIQEDTFNFTTAKGS